MRKLITSVLTVMLLLSAVLPASVIPAAAADQPYAHAVKVIRALGLMDSENSVDFFENQPLTRADAVRYILNLRNVEVTEAGAKQYFSDVPSYDSNFHLISTAVSLGLVRGDGGLFRPEDKVTGTEAAIMLLRAMGYDNMADPMGGGVSNYLSVALDNNFFYGITDYGAQMTRGAFARLLYNSFGIGIVEQTSFGGDNQFKINPDKTALSFRNMARETGIVTENSVTSIYDTAEPSMAGRVIINQKEFEVNGTNAADYLGYKVECYYIDEVGVDIPKIHYITDYDNEEMILDLSTGTLSADGDKLVFYDDSYGRKQTLDINPTTSIILNGKAVAYDLNTIVNASSTGKLKFVNNKDKAVTAKYGVVFVSAEVNDRVRSVDLENNKIYLKNSLIDGKPEIDLTDDYGDKQISITMNGKEIALSDVPADTVITYMISGDRKNVAIVISDKTAKGAIDSYDTEKNGSIYVAGARYPLASDFYGRDRLVVGSNAVVYLNAGGYAVDMDITLDKNYAYLAGTLVEEGLEESVKIKLFTANSTFSVFTLAEKVTIYEGVNILDPELTYHVEETSARIPAEEAAAKLLANNGEMIVYSLNGKGLVSEVRFALNLDPASAIQDPDGKTRKLAIHDLEYYEDKFVLSKHLTKSTQAAYGNIGGVGTTNTVVFSLPTDTSGEINEEDCQAAVNLLVNSQSYSNLKFYDAGINGNAKVALMQQGVAADITSVNRPLCLYKRTVQAVDKEGMPKQKIYYYKNGVEESVLVAEEVQVLGGWGASFTLDNVSFGDAFIYDTDNNGELKIFAPIFDASKLAATGHGVLFYKGNGVEKTREFQILLGTLRYSGSDGFTLRMDDNPDYTFYPLIPNKDASAFRVKMDREVLNSSDIGSIRTESFGSNPQPGETVLVRANRGAVQEVIIYEGGSIE